MGAICMAKLKLSISSFSAPSRSPSSILRLNDFSLRSDVDSARIKAAAFAPYLDYLPT